MGRRMAVAVICLLVLLVLLGVLTVLGRPAIMPMDGTASAFHIDPVPMQDKAMEGRAAEGVAKAAANEMTSTPPQLASAGAFRMPSDAMMVRSGAATLEVDSLAAALDRARELAGQLGGFVAGTNAQAGRTRPRSAMLELRVPSPRFDELAQGLGVVGRLEHVQISTEDVGEEFSDVAARVANGKRMEGRLLDLLAQRTGKLQDALTVERELARVREEIERYEARLRYLQARTSMSRFTLSLHEPLPVLSGSGPSPLRDAVRQAWRNFIEVTALAIASLGVVAPIGLVAGGAWWMWRRRRPALA
jgi:hypothetical protein